MSNAPPIVAGPKASAPSSVTWNTGPPSASRTALDALSVTGRLRAAQFTTGPLVPSASPDTPSARLTARVALRISAVA